jgi:tripartite-type tricarboxylate transporter receptor subunit TctC
MKETKIIRAGGDGANKRNVSIKRRVILSTPFALTASRFAYGQKSEDSYKFIVPSGPGSAIDVTARFLGQELAKDGSNWVVENQTGAGGIIGTQAVARSAPNGRTLGIVSSNYAITPALQSVNFDPVADIAPVAITGSVSLGVAVRADHPAKDMKQFIELARANAGQASYGTGGVATIGHIAGEVLASMAKISMLHVPYRGTERLMTDLVGGRLDSVITATSSCAPFVQSGQIRLLAVTGNRRVSAFPDVPTVAESGLDGYKMDSWIAIIAPGYTPRTAQEEIWKKVSRALENQALRKQLQAAGIEGEIQGPEDARQVIHDDLARFARLIPTLNVT